MNSSKIITAVLLLFLGLSVGFLMFGKGLRRDKQSPSSYSAEYSPSEKEQPGQEEISTLNKPDFTGVIVYYFHGNVRCATCLKIEALAREAVETGFADELGEGTLEWRAVNVEDPVHEHYIEDFQLSSRTVVLEKITGGKREGLKKLDRVWELVHGDREDFIAYVQDETRGFFEAVEK